ncbi:MAG: proliferating cell nuclear antigen (pcna) [archaeon]|nr:proliferating cell nuclear antigen (pcna) [archaeon]
MFKAEIKSETLKGLVNIVSTLVDEVKFVVGSEGVSITAIDPAHIALISVSIDKDAFIFYEADGGNELGIDLDKFKNVLKLSSANDTIIMEYDEERNLLTLHIGNITRRMGLVDTMGMGDPRLPNVPFDSVVTLKAEHLLKGIRASEDISDFLRLSVQDSGFELSCEGDLDFASLKIEPSDLEELKCDGDSTCLYPIDYFSDVVKVIPSGTSVTLKMSSDLPVTLRFDLAEGKAEVVYFLAPRVENE